MSPMIRTETESRAVIYLKLTLMAIFWGGTFVAGRIVAREAGPFSAAFLRFVVASFFLLLFVLKKYGTITLPRREQLLLLLILGMTGVFAYNFFFFSGLKTITASRASLIIAANPAFIALGSALIFKEAAGLIKITGIVLSVFGASIVVLRGDLSAISKGGIGPGELYIIGCVASWVAYSLVGKAAMKDLSPLLAVTLSCIVGAACLAVPAFNEGVASSLPDYSALTWLGIGFLGFFGSALGFVWYYEGILALGPARAGIFINLVPISSVLLAYILLNESLDASLLVGAILVTCGVYLANRSRG